MACGTRRIRVLVSGTIAALLTLQVSIWAQGRGTGEPALPRNPRGIAPIDLTGYWVSLVTQDWRYRMIAGAKGDFPGIPLNAEGRRVGNEWDPVRDEAMGEQCRAYGAAGIMRLPTRLHITWEDDATLKVETDFGTQTRRFRFGDPPAPAPPSWQGTSVASWDLVARGRAGGLKVVTTNMRMGYLRRNGPPYSANAVLTEFYDVVREPDGTPYLIVMGIVEDPTYLNGTAMSSAQFKKQADASGWNPTPCAAG